MDKSAEMRELGEAIGVLSLINCLLLCVVLKFLYMLLCSDPIYHFAGAWPGLSPLVQTGAAPPAAVFVWCDRRRECNGCCCEARVQRSKTNDMNSMYGWWGWAGHGRLKLQRED